MKRALFFAFLVGLLLTGSNLQAQVYTSCGCSCNWGYWNTGSNHTVLIEPLMGFTVTVDGTPVVSNATTEVYIGVFYDSLGTLKNAGFVQWTGASTAITAWGAESGITNGLASGEVFKWKVCVKNLTTGAVSQYTPTVTYLTAGFPNTSNYMTNGMSALGSVAAVSAVGVAATAVLTPFSGCGLSNAESVQVSFTNNQVGIITGAINLSYSINGGTPVTGVYSGGLTPGQTATYTFSTPANLSALGAGNTDSTYTITFSAQLATGTDVNPADNIISVQVTNAVPPIVSFSVNPTTNPTYPNYCYYPGMSYIQLIGQPANGTFSGAGVDGNSFIPFLAKDMCPTCTSFEVCYEFYDAVTECMGSYCDTIYLNTPPTATITNNDLELCAMDTITVVGMPAGGIYQGSGYLNSSTGVFNPQIAGQYPVTYKYIDPNTGCSDTSTVSNFTVYALPNASIVGMKRAYCSDGADVTLNGNPAGGTFSAVSSGLVIQNNVLKPSMSTAQTHTVKYAYTDNHGCFDDVTLGIKIFNGNPTLDFTGLQTAYCLGDPNDTLTPTYISAPATLTWTGAANGILVTSPIGVHTVSLTGVWNNIYYSDTAFCNNVATHSTIVNALPIINLSSNQPISNIGSIETAEPDTVSLHGGPGFIYLWSTGATTPNITATGYGNYSITVTHQATGCHNSDTIAITGTDLKILEMVSPSSNCEITDPCEIPVTVKLVNVGTYTFQAPDKFTFTGKIGTNLVQSQIIELGAYPPISIIHPGDTVLFTFANTLPGCASLATPGDYPIRVVSKFMPNTTIFQLPDVKPSNDTLNITISNGGLPVVDLGTDITSGSPDTISLDAGAGFVSYLWTAGSPGSVDQIISVPLFFGDEEFCVEVTDIYGCKANDCIVIYNGIDDLAASYGSFNVYPNPSNGHFYVEMNNLSNKPVVFDILDTQGRVVMTSTSNSTNQFTKEFDVTGLPKGLYSIRAFNGIDYVTSHFVLQ